MISFVSFAIKHVEMLFLWIVDIVFFALDVQRNIRKKFALFANIKLMELKSYTIADFYDKFHAHYNQNNFNIF